MSASEPLWLPLGELLVDRGLLSERQLELALVEQQRTARPLGEVLVSLGFVSEPALASTLLEQVGLAAQGARHAPVVPAPVARPSVPEPPRVRAHAEVPKPKPVFVRVDEALRGDSKNRVAELEKLIADFERRSAEIQAQIAEMRGLIAALKRPVPAAG